MSTALRIPAPQSRTSRRIPVLGALSAAVATASIALTLAVTGGGDTTSQPSGEPATATPDRATLYQRGVEAPQPRAPIDGNRAAERFHHFR